MMDTLQKITFLLLHLSSLRIKQINALQKRGRIDVINFSDFGHLRSVIGIRSAKDSGCK